MRDRAWSAEGIILKRHAVGETDRILTVFTARYGKVRLIAKGIRRVKSRRAPHLEVFTRARLYIHAGKTLDSVAEVEPIETYQGIRNDLARVSVAYFLCELVDVLTPEKQEHAEVFTLLSDALLDLAKSEGGLYQQTRTFALSLLWTLGFLPRSKKLQGRQLEAFIESIAEKHLRTPQFVRRML